MRAQAWTKIGSSSLSGTLVALSVLICQFPINAQSAVVNKVEERSVTNALTKIPDDDAQNQQRAFAVSLLTALGNEARAYDDPALRPRILARAADVLWTSDHPAAQALFRRAWEAAEKGDTEEVTVKKDTAPAMVVALRRMGGHDLRSEVLNLVAKRDHALAEEFLAKLKTSSDAEAQQSKNPARSNDGWSTPDVLVKRLQAANQLLNEGQFESALEFAAPALNQVSAASIGFLTNLRAKRPEVADQRFAMLMSRVESDPLSDANTVSGLSTYAFTPGFYITFSADGSAVWSQADNETQPPNLPAALRSQFFAVAGAILLRPVPSPEQDLTSSGTKGKYMVVKHLLPLFDQYAPDIAVALHAQLAALAGDRVGNEPFGLQAASGPKSTGDVINKMQSDLDHAKTSKERDEICAAAAVKLALKGDARARDIANRIDDSDRRLKVLQYVDFEFIQAAIRRKQPEEAVRLAKTGQIVHSQRAWTYIQAARLLPETQRDTAAEFLASASEEIQRIDDNPRDRAILLIGVARRLFEIDRPLAWQTMNDLIKSANQADNFTGENLLTFSIGTRSDIKFTQIGGEESGLTGIFQLLAKDDLYRSVDLAKTFKKDAPRATATLAIASSLLAKSANK